MGRLRGSFFILRKTFRGIRKTFDAASEELLMRHQKVVGCASLGDVTLRLALQRACSPSCEADIGLPPSPHTTKAKTGTSARRSNEKPKAHNISPSLFIAHHPSSVSEADAQRRFGECHSSAEATGLEEGAVARTVRRSIPSFASYHPPGTRYSCQSHRS